jgi:hypothetical protein
MEEKNIIVAIDFGSSNTGYAYAFKGKNNNEIYYGTFPSTGASIKTLNKVIINDNNEVVKYGHEVDIYIKKGNLKSNEYLFDRIKMNLYKNIYTIKAVNSSKEMNLVDIIAIILEYIKKKAIEEIVKSIKGITNNYNYDEENEKVRWVLTVPAIWDDKNKNIMMEAAEKAGLISSYERGKNLFFALEPEAASYYCERDQNLDPKLFENPYIICDLGGGTGDLVCHKRVIENGVEKIKEAHIPEGGPFGSDEINKKFENEVLKVIFGSRIFDELKEKFKGENNKRLLNKYIKLNEEINNFKENLDENSYNNDELLIDCSLLYKACGQNFNIKNAIEKYNNNCRNGWKIQDFGEDDDDRTITFPYKIIYDLTNDIAENVSKSLKKIIANVSNVSTIFYVGGFCESKSIVSLIRKNISKDYPNIKQICPSKPGNAIIRGAILFGLNPQKIKTRKARFSIGICAYLDWEKKFENGGKRGFDSEFNKYACTNGFYCFINKNDDIPFDNEVTKPMLLRDFGDNKYGGELLVYKSTKSNTLFIDEEGVDEIGKFKLLIDDGNKYEMNERIFQIKMQFGGTCLNAIVEHKNSSTTEKFKFTY